MKYLKLMVALFVTSNALAVEETDYARILRGNDFKYCASAVNKASNWLVGQDAGTIGLWKPRDADNHVGVLIASKRFSDTSSLMHLSAMRTAAGGCDLSFSLVYTFNKACSVLRDTTFKEWKFFGDVKGIPVYDDPTTSNVQVVLQPFGIGCVVSKMGVLFYDKDDVASMVSEAQRIQSSTVTIAHVGPTSGPIAHLGKDNENGARLAIEELNAAGVVIGGKTVTLTLLAEDDASTPKQGIAVAQKLVDAKVSGVIGHLNSGTTIPASRLYNTAGIPQVSPSATNPKYTRQGFNTAFRLIADDVQLGATLGRFVAKGLKGKAIAVIDDRTAYGISLAEEFTKTVESMGGNIIATEFTTDKATDFTTILTAIKGKKPDAIFFGGMDTTAAPMLRQMKAIGINSKFIGGDGICSSDLTRLSGDAIADNQVYCAEAGGVEEKYRTGMEAFKAKFKARFSSDVQVYAPYTYDAVKVMVAAMVKAGSSDPVLYLPVLAATSDFVGVTGPISFDERGDIKSGALTLKTIRGGRLTTLAVIR